MTRKFLTDGGGVAGDFIIQKHIGDTAHHKDLQLSSLDLHHNIQQLPVITTVGKGKRPGLTLCVMFRKVVGLPLHKSQSTSLKLPCS